MAKRKGGKKAKGASSSSAKAKTKRQPPQPTIYICPYTNQNVYICKATLKDLKAKSTYTNSSKKRLWILTSPQVRNDHYLRAAEAIASTEQALLPSCGGRSWEVTCKLTEPHWSGQVLFRSWKGEMELAVLPHLLEKIPEPPTWAGKKAQPDEYESDEEGNDGLQQREISSLSSVAWDLKDSYPVPTVTLKWQSPQRKIFNSRKAAWEHASHIAKVEVQITKSMLGIGASGKLLQPFFPSDPNALKMGKVRFERDGLWVVGQEVAWQADRPDELLEEEAEEEERRRENPSDDLASFKSGLDLYLKTNRETYRGEHSDTCATLKQAETELRKAWKAFSDEERDQWNARVRAAKGDDSDNGKKDSAVSKKPKSSKKSNENENKKSSKSKKKEPDPEPTLKLSTTPKAFFVKSRRHEYRKELEEQGRRVTLGEIEIWLREEWKTMEVATKLEWKEKLIAQETEKAKAAAAEAQVKADAEAKEAAETEAKANTDAEAKKSVVSDLEVAAGFPVCAKSEAGADSFKAIIQPPSKDHENYMLATAATSTPTALFESKDTPSDPKPTQSSDVLCAEAPFSEEKKEDEVMADSTPSADKAIDKTTPVLPLHVDKKTDMKVEERQEVPSTSTSSPTAVVTSDLQMSLKHKRPVAKKTRKKPKSGQPPKHALERWCLNEEQMDLCYSACMEHYETVMRTVKARDLHRELQDGFDVLRERGFGRYDMELPAFDTASFDFLTSLKKAPWMPIVRTILGEEVVLIHKGCFLSMPGAAPQEYHQDGVHLSTQTQRPCHAINVFIPLVDLNTRNGPTEFCLGSHILGLEGYDRDFVEIPKPKAGTPMIFDYRLGHRGLGNSSQACRPIVYCTYARVADGKEFRDSVNFSRKRYHKIGELSAKPMSREERRNNRKRSNESREQCQALKDVLVEISKEKESVSASTGLTNDGNGKDHVASSQVDPALPAEKKTKTVVRLPVAVQGNVSIQQQAIALSLEIGGIRVKNK